MRERRWYRSLYWRIALGLFAFLALMLAAEGALFLWVTDRIAGAMPARSPRRLAVLVASDVGAALTRDPALDLESYLREQYGPVFQTFAVILRDGRAAANHDVAGELIDALRSPRERAPGPDGGRGTGRRARGRAQSDGERELPDGDRRRMALALRGERATVFVNGQPAGRVQIVTTEPRISLIARQLGPTIGLMAGGVLLVGTALIALVVFGPTRRRLKQVQAATERLGTGDLAARAPEEGGDEVAAVAHSFNRMADELATRARALEASDKARRQLLADVSHELMTPLTAMRGYVETLGMAEFQLDPATRQRYMQIVTDETHRLEQIVGDLLDLARLEGGGVALRHERVAVATLFARVTSRHERELNERGIEMAVQVRPEASHVAGDPDRLEQAFQNLAANALRHTPAGGRIELSSERRGDEVVLTVRDSGPGIPPEHLPLIFERFYKADASRRAAKGSGLGLSIVKAIVESHGGTITAFNDRGAVFQIALPSVPAA